MAISTRRFGHRDLEIAPTTGGGVSQRLAWAQLLECVLGLMPAWDPAEVGAFRYLEGGYSNRNYRFRYRNEEFVLRLPGKPTAFTDRGRESLFYRSVPSETAPEVLGFDVDTGHMVSRWIHGRLLADLRPSPERMVDYLKDLHERLGTMRDACRQAVERNYDPVDQTRAFLALADALPWIQHWPKACRGGPTILPSATTI
jgi:hypothetical protein